MGAHIHEDTNQKGVMFCIWAPNAKSISIIGEINSWDGRHHPMQKRQGGIWELFMPIMKEGDAYKYEIRTQQGHIYEKADPYGFLHEIRPQNGSIVSKLNNFYWFFTLDLKSSKNNTQRIIYDWINKNYKYN